ncbi:MAG: hypothetical protein AUK44_06615 [Porphyromonadaceae bacterium CG2_30_38_12]|nr:MAG: hypothetical protein AUK44_06615 [Porphyromonadaceae bacterium CG2_30_38_12]
MAKNALKILAVDDIYDNLVTIKALVFESFSEVEIRTANSGKEALEIATLFQPHVILLDVVMPVMDGFEVCRKLKADPALRDIPVVFVTAQRGDKESRIKALELGAEAFLSKPIDASELVAQIRSMHKISVANRLRKSQNELLKDLVAERTEQLEIQNVATNNILLDLKKEISNRKHTEQALRKSEALLRRAELASKSGNWEFNIEDKRFYFSHGAAFLLGFCEPHCSYAEFDKILVPEYQHILKNAIDVLEKNETAFSIELKLQTASSNSPMDIRMQGLRNNEESQIFGIIRDITEHKSVREKLAESEKMYKAIIQASPDSIVIINPQGAIEIVSPAFTQTLGYDSDKALIGKTYSDLIAPEDIGKVHTDLLSILKAEANDSAEYSCICKDGSLVEMEVKAGVIHDAKLQVKKIVVMGRDISERKKNQQELIRSEAELRAVWKNSANALRLTDEHGYILRVNDAYCKFVEKTEHELVGSLMANVYHPSYDKDELNKYKHKFAQSILDRNYEKEIILWNERKKWVQIDKTFLELNNDNKLMLTIFNDITIRKNAQIALEESETKYRELIDNSPEGITIYEDGKIVYVNKEAMQLMHATNKSDLLGRSLLDFIVADNLEIIMERMKFVAHVPLYTKLPPVEEKYRRLDGTEMTVEIWVMPILFEGKPAIQISGHDISERKIEEAELVDNRVELKAIYDNAPVLMCVLNEKSELLFANNAMNAFVEDPILSHNTIRTFGNIFDCVESIENQNGCGFGKKCNQCLLRKAIRKTFQTGEGVQNIDYETERLVDSKLIPVSLLASTAILQSGSEKKLLLCMVDITARRHAENVIHESQMQLKSFATHLQTVREEERINLAREIHDDLGQLLVAIKFDIGMLGIKSKKFINKEFADEFGTQFKRLESYVNKTLVSARRIMSDLRPELLDMVGLVDAFKEHIKNFNERQSIVCNFVDETTDQVAMDSNKSIALFRILQEALNNAQKYSEATKIMVTLGSKNQKTYLIIEDNGKGFDLELKKRKDSYGLTGMKERAYLLGGAVDIWSAVGKGVKITVEVPDKK